MREARQQGQELGQPDGLARGAQGSVGSRTETAGGRGAGGQGHISQGPAAVATKAFHSQVQE